MKLSLNKTYKARIWRVLSHRQLKNYSQVKTASLFSELCKNEHSLFSRWGFLSLSSTYLSTELCCSGYLYLIGVALSVAVGMFSLFRLTVTQQITLMKACIRFLLNTISNSG